ncbi:ABC-type multidrug transport system permease subunit [Paenibacillus sp. V4I7]|nr:ABC-type multidrug transport system permease subunit [Paenibacillus sp. V4I7]MDQ0919500.1 ABC-type multidrug transport system permease subunit [Paenibacillus sp. V4I5]
MMVIEGMKRTGETNKSSVKFFEGEKWLVLTGLLGFLLAGICAVWVLLYGGPVSPDGNISNAVSFNAALGIFLLSTAALAPFSAMGVKGRAFFRWSYILLALYSYFAETVQNFRGVNPRFVKSGMPFDEMVGDIFAFVALFLILCYLFLAIQYFRKKAYMRHPALVVGIRYAMIAVMLSFMAGIWISVNNGRIVGVHGNIIVLHGLGFHALQALPVVAWLSDRTSFTANARSKWTHLTGITYLLGLIAIGWQTYLGRSIFEWSVLSLLICSCFLISLATGVQVLRKTSLPSIGGKFM